MGEFRPIGSDSTKKRWREWNVFRHLWPVWRHKAWCLLLPRTSLGDSFWTRYDFIQLSVSSSSKRALMRYDFIHTDSRHELRLETLRILVMHPLGMLRLITSSAGRSPIRLLELIRDYLCNQGLLPRIYNFYLIFYHSPLWRLIRQYSYLNTPSRRPNSPSRLFLLLLMA